MDTRNTIVRTTTVRRCGNSHCGNGVAGDLLAIVVGWSDNVHKRRENKNHHPKRVPQARFTSREIFSPLKMVVLGGSKSELSPR
ncbi:hypothetical protein RB195_013855 [Necator americanus]|uniref:Uncharacterized protein n=1 Tax=Necator americanus TaxID=51031 RepID=A0ABR1DXL4_NECAM